MSDEPVGDDIQTQREKRAERHRATRAQRAPTDWARRIQVMKAPLIILLVVAAGAGAIWYLQSNQQACPDHWHSTQAVFVPSGAKDGAYDDFQRIDWASPVAPNGRPYYDFGNNPKMSIGVHMHLTGSERGDDSSLGPAQFHFEGAEKKCVGIQSAYNVIDLKVDSDSITVGPGSPLAVTNPGGPWQANETEPLRFFLQSQDASGAWVWSERPFGDYLHHQLRNGEAMVLAIGHYSDAQLEQMKGQVPAPSGRPMPPVVIAPTTATSSSTSMATNSTAA